MDLILYENMKCKDNSIYCSKAVMGLISSKSHSVFFFKGVAGLIPDANIQIHIRFISHSIYCSLGVVDQIPDKNTKVTFTSN